MGLQRGSASIQAETCLHNASSKRNRLRRKCGDAVKEPMDSREARSRESGGTGVRTFRISYLPPGWLSGSI